MLGTIHAGGIQKDEHGGQRVGRDFSAQNAVRDRATGQFCLRCNAWHGQLGLEPTWQLFIQHLCECAEEWWRVLKPTGNLFVNIGDSFFGMSRTRKESPGVGAKQELSAPRAAVKWQAGGGSNFSYTSPSGDVPKHKLGIPYRLRFALNDMGWVSRGDYVWYKGKEYPDGKITKVAMPESVKDRMSCSYEMVFHFVKKPKGYWFDLDAVRKPHITPLQNLFSSGRRKYAEAAGLHDSVIEPLSTVNPAGANPGDVWIIQPEPFRLEHYAVWPSKLCEMMIRAGCPKEVCPKCGKPRERITRTENPPHDGETESFYVEGTTARRLAMLRQAARKRGGEFIDRRYTIGWSDCKCGEDFVSGVVLDPFGGGSGRLAKEARKLGRRAIIVDLKRDYLEMSKDCLVYGEKELFKEKKRREKTGMSQGVLW